MTLQAYFDESQKNGGDLVVAGYIATAENWANFSTDWNSLLKSKKLDKFHSVKLRDKTNLREMFFRIIEKHIEHCAFCVVKTSELHDVVNNYNFSEFDDLEGLEKLKRRLKNPYHHAVKNILVSLSERIGQIDLTPPYSVIFDERTEKVSVLEAYEFLKFSAPDNLKIALPDKPFFMSDDKTPPLQAADLFAYELRSAQERGINLRNGRMFTWGVNKEMKCFYTYLGGELLREQLEYILSDENLKELARYDGCIFLEDIDQRLILSGNSW